MDFLASRDKTAKKHHDVELDYVMAQATGAGVNSAGGGGGGSCGSTKTWSASVRWLKRLDPCYERPSLLRQSSYRFLYPYVVVVAVCLVYFVYVANTPSSIEGGFRTDSEPAPRINLDAAFRPTNNAKHAAGGTTSWRDAAAAAAASPADAAVTAAAAAAMKSPSVGPPPKPRAAKIGAFRPVKDVTVEGGPADVESVVVSGATETKTILLWNTFFGERDYIPSFEQICPNYPCRVTTNRSDKADAVVVHLRDISPLDLPRRRSRNEIFVLLNAEAPPHTPALPDSINDLFNWTITYRRDADIPLTKRVVLKYRYEPIAKDYHANKTKLATWFVSHCHTSSERELLVAKLAKYGVHTAVVGECGHLTCPRTKDCYAQFSQDYLFYLSLENAICNDYVTEKLFNVFQQSEMVPVVLGGADYSLVAPPGSYINANKFASVEQLARYLQRVSNDPVLYNSYHRWRSYYQVSEPAHYACRLCAKLHTNGHRRMYQDFNTYWHNGTCHGSWYQAYRLK